MGFANSMISSIKYNLGQLRRRTYYYRRQETSQKLKRGLQFQAQQVSPDQRTRNRMANERYLAYRRRIIFIRCACILAILFYAVYSIIF